MILDLDQSIYSFRGASLNDILKIDRIFKNVKTFTLSRNYRSSQKIVSAACSLIHKNKTTIKKDLYSKKEAGENVIYFEERDQEAEAIRCTRLIKMLTSKFGMKNKDICILYRMGYMSRAIEESFLKNSIPYSIVGGMPFCSRREIKDILCFAKTIFNPYDFESFKRTLNIPKRGIGEINLDRIKEHSRRDVEPLDFLTVAKEIELKGKAKKGLQEYSVLMRKLSDLRDENVSPSEFLEAVIQELDYYNLIEKEDPEGYEDRILNVKELVNIACTFESLEEFLENMSLNSQMSSDEESSDDKVQLMTLHSSKGLEFKTVILIGCNEGTSPHYMANTQDSLEEERRLFYVGMTRAEQYLFLTRAKRVMQNGRYSYVNESRFIKEIDSQYLTKAK